MLPGEADFSPNYPTSVKAYGIACSSADFETWPLLNTPGVTEKGYHHMGAKCKGLSQRILLFQLLLELVEEAPVGPLGEDLLGGALDHPCFVQAERIKADRVLGVVLAPLRIGELPQCLQGIVIVGR